MSITQRPVLPGDQRFLFDLYAGTREEEVAQTGWEADQKQAFLKFQFDAQMQDYKNRFADAEHKIICEDERPVGRIYVARREKEIRILDITMVPERRGAGIGTSLLRDLQTEAKSTNRPVRIYVENTNPSRSLFHRLGFSPMKDNGLLSQLEWRAEAAPSPSP